VASFGRAFLSADPRDLELKLLVFTVFVGEVDDSGGFLDAFMDGKV
jgi:hypothetical protein